VLPAGQAIERSRREALEVSQNAVGLGVAGNSDDNVHVVSHHRHGADSPLSESGRRSDLLQNRDRLLRSQAKRRRRLRSLGVKNHSAPLVVVFGSRLIVNATLTLLIPYATDETTLVSRQPGAVGGPSDQPVALHTRSLASGGCQPAGSDLILVSYRSDLCKKRKEPAG
jgi:hypothetical protein